MVLCCLLALLVLLFCKSVSSIILGFRGEREREWWPGLGLECGGGWGNQEFCWWVQEKTDVSLSAFYFSV